MHRGYDRHDLHRLSRLTGDGWPFKGPAARLRGFVLPAACRRTKRPCFPVQALHILRPMIQKRFPLCALLALSVMAGACSQPPDIPPLVENAAITPQLVPLEALLGGLRPPVATDAAVGALAGRAARLRARADLMRGPVLQPETRRRLAAAIAGGDA